MKYKQLQYMTTGICLNIPQNDILMSINIYIILRRYPGKSLIINLHHIVLVYECM